MDTLRVGVVGLNRGRLFVDVFRRVPECEVVAVCDLVPARLEPYADLSAHVDYGSFLATGLDIVAVITPGPVHAEQAVAALQAGAHVLCETPCVYSLEEAIAVARAARASGRRYMLAEDYLWRGWGIRLRQMAEADAFGEIVYAEGDYTHDCRDIMLIDGDQYVPYAERAAHPDAAKSWRATDLAPLLYTSHTLGPLLHAMDDRVVSAVGVSTGTHTAPDLGTIDLEAGLFETERGAVVRLTNGFSVAHPYSLHLKLVGTKGSIVLQHGAGVTGAWYSETVDPPMAGWQAAPDSWQKRADGSDPVAAMVRDFVAGILGGGSLPLDVYRSCEFVLPGVTAHQSAMLGGKKLPVPDLRELA